MAKKAQEQETTNRGGGLHHVPAQEDENDILEEVGAEQDEETGELVVDEDKIRELGAIDPETVRENRRISSVANKQKIGKKRVPFGTNDPLVKYDGLLKSWGPNSIYVQVKRLTGAQVTHQIRSCPRSGVELYDALMSVHGQHPEAEYELTFKSTDGHQYRGTGRIVLPDTRPQSQQGQSMYYPPPNGAPYYPPSNGAASSQQPAPQPQQPLNQVEQLGQMLEMFQRFSQRSQPQQPQLPTALPPQPPPGADAGTQMAWMKQVFDLFQQMQGGARAAPVAPPPTPAPSSSIDEMTKMIELFKLFQTLGNNGGGNGSPGPMNREPRSPYYPQGDPNGRPMQPFQQRRQAPTDPYREALGVVRSAMALAEEFDSILPGRHGGRDDAPPPEDDDSPVRVTKIGDIDTVRDPDGTMRWGETALANVPKGIKWFSEQMDKVKIERQRQQPQQRQQLPTGYIEVPADYQPPPGYVVVPVDQTPPSDQGLPPPPARMPPPIQPGGRSWDAPPSIPDSEDE